MASRTEDWLEANRRAVLEGFQDRLYLNTGPEGVGKSNNGLWLGKQLAGDRFTAECIAFGTDEFIHICSGLRPGDVAMLDEPIDGLISRDAMADSNKRLMKYLIVARENHVHMIVNSPNINFVDRYVRDHRAHFWLLGMRHGSAMLHKRRRADYQGAKSSWPKMHMVTGIPDMRGTTIHDEYQERKKALVRDVGLSADVSRWEPTEQDQERLAKKFALLMR